MKNQSNSLIKTLAVIGNHLPRQCGIATFTADLCAAVEQAYPATEVFALAMNDHPDGYDYPERVRFTIDQHELLSYRRAADGIDLSNADVVCVQHEYGIFGGEAGSDLLSLLRTLRAPIVTTLHTVLQNPNLQQRRVLVELAQLSDRMVVMSERGASFLHDVYGVPKEKIDYIPHGIPDVPFLDTSFHKDAFGFADKQVLLTFGLLSSNKGIEHVIHALPKILVQHPNVIYVVLGATHPHVHHAEGESYRESLQVLARQLGVEREVVFCDQFVAFDELVKYISMADIYITPYLNEAQIVSGTLAYTVGAGKAVISTPYWYAEELLADGRGVLVPFASPEAIAAQTIELLNNEVQRDAMRKQAYLFGREMIWSQVAERYMASFVRARSEHRFSQQVTLRRQTNAKRKFALPPLKLDHLRRMTDDTGMLQHAVMALPNPNEGYTTDDNARALIAAVKLEERGNSKATELATRYMAFLWHAFNPEAGRFRNFMRYDRHWLEEIGSEDSHARALWALGTTLGHSANPVLTRTAISLFTQALDAIHSFTHPRPLAFTLLGLDEYLQRFPGDQRAARARATLAERLFAWYQNHQAEDWPWFGEELTYDNPVLPHALLLSGHALGRSDMYASSLEALTWLSNLQRSDEGYFSPVGCHGFARRNGERATFDQQPLEAHAMVLAALAAKRITGEAIWGDEAQCAFDWFLGQNALGLALYDHSTGGCCDGLLMDRVNQNQGAESTLAFLLARLEMQQVGKLPKLLLIAEKVNDLSNEVLVLPNNRNSNGNGSIQ